MSPLKKILSDFIQKNQSKSKRPEEEYKDLFLLELVGTSPSLEQALQQLTELKVTSIDITRITLKASKESKTLHRLQLILKTHDSEAAVHQRINYALKYFKHIQVIDKLQRMCIPPNILREEALELKIWGNHTKGEEFGKNITKLALAKGCINETLDNIKRPQHTPNFWFELLEQTQNKTIDPKFKKYFKSPELKILHNAVINVAKNQKKSPRKGISWAAQTIINQQNEIIKNQMRVKIVTAMEPFQAPVLN
jgi:hypothetical protein